MTVIPTTNLNSYASAYKFKELYVSLKYRLFLIALFMIMNENAYYKASCVSKTL
jgi:hypothetical protein